MIAYPLSLPAARGPARWLVRPLNAVASTRSPFTFTEQIQVHQGQAWSVEVELPPMPVRAHADAWVAFLVALKGRRGTFLMRDPLRRLPKGAGTGEPRVDGAHAAGVEALATKGWTAATAGILRAGDLIQLGAGATASLHMVLADAASDGGRLAVLDLWPRLRRPAANSDPLEVEQPLGLWRLASDPSYEMFDRLKTGLGFAAVEAL